MATLLYVDDNSQRLQALTARLEHAGYRVFSATNGDEALRIFKNKPVDLAIVDYYMHGMGGDLVAVEMKRIRGDIPIIIFSGTFTMSEMVIALADGFVFTGENPDRLVDKVAELLPHDHSEPQSPKARRKGAA